MSYFDDASLVMIPSGYKTSKVYSVKPTDGSGDLTFSRSNDTATRVNSAGLIEKVRTNLVLQSNTFNTTWVINGTGTVTTGATDPFGGATAWTLAKTAANTFLYQSTVGFSGSNTFSIYAKAGTIDQLWLNHDQSGSFSSYFDLTLGTAIAPAGCVATIVSVGGGWYRCSIAGTIVTPNNIRIYPASGGSISGTTGNILIYGIQCETGDIATDYIATTSAAVSVGPVANVPRLDYLNSSCPRLLLEPQRTNSAQYSEQADNAYWLKYQCSITANQAVSPDGYTNADSLTMSTNGIGVIYRNIGTAGAVSCFMKSNSLGTGNFYISVDGVGEATWNANGVKTNTPAAGTSYDGVSYGNGWYRFTYVVSSGNTVNFGIAGGTTGDSILLWGFQNEASASYATSYIPTLGAAVTRGADACSKTGISSLIGQTAGSFYFEYVPNDVSVSTAQDYIPFALSDGTTSNCLFFNDYNGNLSFYIQYSGAGQTAINFPDLIAGNTYKIAVGYNTNDVALYINGVLVGTDTSVSIPATSKIQFNGFTSPVHIGSIKVSQALLFTTRLSNSDLAALTA